MRNRIFYGYQERQGRLELAQEEAIWVTQIFQWYVKEQSLHQVAKRLMEQKIPTLNGKLTWTHGAIGRILANTCYLGEKGYPPLIEAKLFDTANTIRQRKQEEKAKPKGKRNNWTRAFQGKVSCGICGEPYQYAPHRRKPEERPGTWKCQHLEVGSQKESMLVKLREEEVIEGVIETIERWKKAGKPIPKDPPKTLGQRRKIYQLEERIQHFIEAGESSEKILPLLQERFQLQYEILPSQGEMRLRTEEEIAKAVAVIEHCYQDMVSKKEALSVEEIEDAIESIAILGKQGMELRWKSGIVIKGQEMS